MHDFAKRLIAHETSGNKPSATNGTVDFAVIPKLRPMLTNLMGNVGFSALISRALALASKKVRWLAKVHINSDGSFQGMDELVEQIDADEFFEGQVVLLAQLLGLLVAFIGENLTWRLVGDVWPQMPSRLT